MHPYAKSCPYKRVGNSTPDAHVYNTVCMAQRNPQGQCTQLFILTMNTCTVLGKPLGLD